MIDSFDRLQAADPAAQGAELPDSVLSQDALLVIIDEEAGSMSTQTPLKPTQRSDRPRRGWLVAAAGFAIVMIVAGAIFAVSQRATDVPPADVPATTTTIANALSPDSEAHVAGALDLIEAYNRGDVAAFESRFQEAGAWGGDQITRTDVRSYFEYQFAIGDQLEVVSCDPLPIDDQYKPFSGRPEVNVVCSMMGSDQVTADALPPRTVGWALAVSERGAILDVESTELKVMSPFVRDLAEWLHDAEPEVWAEVFAADCDTADVGCVSTVFSVGGGAERWFIGTDAVAELVTHRDVFLAESDEY